MATAKSTARARKPPKCAGTKADGQRCSRKPAAGSKFCAQHDPEKSNRIRDWKPAWIAAFAQQLTVTGACAAVNISRAAAYAARDSDADFAAAWDELVDATTDLLEREAFRRAHDGWIEREECTYDFETGEKTPTLTVRKFSDTLLIFLLKARKPETYRDNHRVEHVGPGGSAPTFDLRLDADSRKVLADVLRGRPATGSE